MTSQPAIYIPHGGGPWPYIEDPQGTWTSLRTFLAQLPATLPQPPSAIAIISAHWEAPTFTIASGDQPQLIYDYGGFPAHTYDVTYPALGAPDIAERVADLASAAGIDASLDPDYGWDHGVFVPVAVSWPNADVPVVAISLKTGLDPTEHYNFGRAIAPLRHENVVLIGSGLSIHDLRFQVSVDAATTFDDWLEAAMMAPQAQRAERLARWADAPGGRASHPREEHLLPAMVIAGAGRDDTPTRSYRGTMFSWPVAAYTYSETTARVHQ